MQNTDRLGHHLDSFRSSTHLCLGSNLVDLTLAPAQASWSPGPLQLPSAEIVPQLVVLGEDLGSVASQPALGLGRNSANDLFQG